jgi:hypothetical protein
MRLGLEIFGWVVLGLFVIIFVMMIPSLVRYLKISRM